MRRLLLVALAVMLVFAASSAMADSFTFTTGDTTIDHLANDNTLGTNYDILHLGSVTNTIDLAPGGTLLQTIPFDFTVGVSSSSVIPSDVRPFFVPITFAGQTQNLALIANVSSLPVGTGDGLIITGIGPLIFHTNMGTVLISLHSPINISSNDHYLGNLALDVTSVPEPTSLALFGSGVLGLATRLWKRTRA